MLEILIAALIMVESSGDPNAINGDAVGILQKRAALSLARQVQH